MKTKNSIICVGILFSFVLAGLIIESAYAAPAAPIENILVQPDGSSVLARQWGMNGPTVLKRWMATPSSRMIWMVGVC